MITIKCTESEKRKLCNTESAVMCGICYELGACKEFEGDCAKCKRHRSKYVKWKIQKKPKAKKSKQEGKNCLNCKWNRDGRCENADSLFAFLKVNALRSCIYYQDKPLKQQVREKSDGPFFGCSGK